jgi:hypothetical protein
MDSRNSAFVSELSVRLAFSGASLAECLHLFAARAMKRVSNVFEGRDCIIWITVRVSKSGAAQS